VSRFHSEGLSARHCHLAEPQMSGCKAREPAPVCSVGRSVAYARRGVFYGWLVVIASALGLLLGPIPWVVFSFGVFLHPFVQEFHASRGSISLARTLNSVVLALSLPAAGRLIDRFGARRVILISTVVSGLVLLSGMFCSGKLWQLYVLYMAMGIASCGAGPVAYCDAVTRWFDRYRGLALGLTMLGLGAGALIVPSAAQALITRYGWQRALEIAGVTILAVGLPILAPVLKDRPDQMGLLPDGGPGPAPEPGNHALCPLGVIWPQVLRTPLFWLLLVAFGLVSAAVTACQAHITPILTDRGMPGQEAALATSLFGAGLLAGRLGPGYLLDRFFAPRVAAVVFGVAACGIGVLRFAASPYLTFSAASLIGLGLGAEVDIMAYLTSRYFGLRSFGTIYAFNFACFGLAGGLGTYLLGAAFDATGSYAPMLSVLFAATLFGAVLMLFPGPYLYQAGSG
jgi:sugar phosphate permease